MRNRQEYMKAYNKAYGQTHAGLIKRIYAHQLRNCRHRNHPLPEYTEAELLAWYLANPAHILLHTDWVNANCDKALTPSIDRIDNSKSYTFSNIRVTTWEQNYRQAYEDTRNNVLKNSGLLNNGHAPVVQYDLTGSKCGEYISLSDAKRTTGIDHRGISDCCRKLRISFHGYVWRYVTDEAELIATPTTVWQEWMSDYTTAKGYLIDVFFKDNTVATYTVSQAAALLNISVYNTRKLARGITTSRSPTLPENITHLLLRTRIETN